MKDRYLFNRLLKIIKANEDVGLFFERKGLDEKHINYLENERKRLSGLMIFGVVSMDLLTLSWVSIIFLTMR